MTALSVFLRNLIVILAVGALGYAVLSLPFDPLLTAGGDAGLLALLMTWLELSRPGAPQSPARPRQAKAAKSRPRRQAQTDGMSAPAADSAAASPASASSTRQSE